MKENYLQTELLPIYFSEWCIFFLTYLISSATAKHATIKTIAVVPIFEKEKGIDVI